MVLSKVSMAQKFSFLRDISCKINVESRPSSRTMFGWPEGHGLSSSEGDDGRSDSQGCEMNGEIDFTSSTRLWLGLCFAIGIFG